MELKLGHFVKLIRNTWKVRKFVPGGMKKFTWADLVRNEEVLHRVKEGRNILHTVKKKEG
jgi:hypothetical protein